MLGAREYFDLRGGMSVRQPERQRYSAEFGDGRYHRVAVAGATAPGNERALPEPAKWGRCYVSSAPAHTALTGSGPGLRHYAT
jgi:hypothetical protein